MSDTIYVVVKIGYEYDDNVYYRSDNGGGEPIQAFHSKELADKYVEEINLDQIKAMRDPVKTPWGTHRKGPGFYEYAWGSEIDDLDVDGGDTLRNMLQNITDDRGHLNPDVTDEQIRQLYEQTNLRWAQVVEVPCTIPEALIKAEIKSREAGS